MCRADSRANNSAISASSRGRSEEHTSELQSPCNLVCRLLLEKKNEHAVFELGANFPWAGIIRKREAAAETAVCAFDAVILSTFLLLLVSAFDPDGQRALLRHD